MNEHKNPYWSEEVDANETYHTPPGTFTKKAPQIVEILLKGADDDPTLALRRLTFYMNRAGTKLTNDSELEKAKTQLESLERREKMD